MNYSDLLASLLLSYFQKHTHKLGSRFFIEVENEEQSRRLHQSLQSLQQAVPFTYTHRIGTASYESYQLNAGDSRVVVAACDTTVSEGFLVTLRNAISSQSKEFENSIGLFIGVFPLMHSISEGALNLSSAGGPLASTKLKEYMLKAIEKGTDTVEKEHLIKGWMNRKADELRHSSSSCFDYEEALDVLQAASSYPKRPLPASAYQKLGYFYIEGLEFEKENKASSLLERSSNLYGQFKSADSVGLLKEATQNLLPNGAITKLQKLFEGIEEWNSFTLQDIDKAIGKEKEGKRVSLELESTKIANVERHIPIQSLGTKAQQRTRQFILFAAEGERLELEMVFDQTLSEIGLGLLKGVDISSDDKIAVKGRRIFASFLATSECRFIQFEYTHKKSASARYKFKIAILQSPYFSKQDVESLNSDIEVDVRNELLVINATTDEGVRFGVGETFNERLLRGKEEEVDASTPLLMRFQPTDTDQESELVTLLRGDATLPLLVNFTTPIYRKLKLSEIGDNARRQQSHTEMIDPIRFSRAKQQTSTFAIEVDHQSYLRYESAMIEQRMMACRIVGGFGAEELIKSELSIAVDVDAAYYELLSVFQQEKTLPSLAHWNERICQAAEKLLNVLHSYIDTMESVNLSLQLLGVLQDGEAYYMTPFHPLMIANRLEKQRIASENGIDESELAKLDSQELLPYWIANQEKGSMVEYLPKRLNSSPLWRHYLPAQILQNETPFVEELVYDKMRLFYNNLGLLFEFSSRTPFVVKASNLESEEGLLKGVIRFMLKSATEEGVRPVHVLLEERSDSRRRSTFEEFSFVESVNQLEKRFPSIKFSSNLYDSDQILKMLQKSLTFRRVTAEDDEKSHLSFVKLQEVSQLVYDHMTTMDSSFRNQSLRVNLTSTLKNEHYFTGIGLRYYSETHLLFNKSVTAWNALSASAQNGGSGAFEPYRALYKRTQSANPELLKGLLEKSFWTILVSPKISMDKLLTHSDQFAILYVDQLSDSGTVDAVTLTGKVELFTDQIERYAKERQLSIDSSQLLSRINQLNGEWSLQLLNKKSNSPLEHIAQVVQRVNCIDLIEHIVADKMPEADWCVVVAEELKRSAQIANMPLSRLLSESIKSLKEFQLCFGFEKIEEGYQLNLLPTMVNRSQLHVDGHALADWVELLNELFDKENSSYMRTQLRGFISELAFATLKKAVASGTSSLSINDLSLVEESLVNGAIDLVLVNSDDLLEALSVGYSDAIDQSDEEMLILERYPIIEGKGNSIVARRPQLRYITSILIPTSKS